MPNNAALTSESASFDLSYIERLTSSALLCYGTHEGSLTDRRQELAACMVALFSINENQQNLNVNVNSSNSNNNSRPVTPRPNQTTNFQLPSILLDDESVVREPGRATSLVRKVLSTVLMCEEARSIFRKEPHAFLRGPTLASAVIDRYFTVHLKSKLCELVEPLVHQIFSIDQLPEELPNIDDELKDKTKEEREVISKAREEACSKKVCQQIIYCMRTLMRIVDTCQWPDGLRLALGDLQDFMVVARYYDEQGGGETRAIRTGELEKDFSSRLASIVALHMLSPLLFSPWSLSLPANPSALQYTVNNESNTPVKYYNQEQRDRLRKRMQKFYEKYAKEGLSNVEKALTMTVTERAMFQKLYAKYKVDQFTEQKEAQEAGLLPEWMKNEAIEENNFNNNNNNNTGNSPTAFNLEQVSSLTITPPTAPPSTQTSQHPSPNPSNNNRNVVSAEESNAAENTTTTSKIAPLSVPATLSPNTQNHDDTSPVDPVQEALDRDEAEQNNNNKTGVAADDEDQVSQRGLPKTNSTLHLNTANSDNNLLNQRSRENSVLTAPQGISPFSAQNSVITDPQEMTRRRRRLALFVKILQKAANNSTFDVPPASSSTNPAFVLPLASTDSQFLCNFNDSLKNEFGQELRRSLRSIPVHWNDYITTEGVDNPYLGGGLAPSNNKTASSNSVAPATTTTTLAAGGGPTNPSKNSSTATPTTETPKTASISGGAVGLGANINNKPRRSRSFTENSSPQRRTKCQKRLKCLLYEDLCQSITAAQGLLPQFPFFEERFRSRLDLWTLPTQVPALPQTELDAMSPFQSDIAAVVGIRSEELENLDDDGDSDSNGSFGSTAAGNTSNPSAPQLQIAASQKADSSSTVITTSSTLTPLDEGRRAITTTGAADPEHFMITNYPSEHALHHLNNSPDNIRPLHADLLQIVRFHPPHVLVIHGELLVRLENKIKSDGSFFDPSSPKPIAISIPECERAIEAHFSARLDIVATKRNRKTGIAVIFLTPNTTQGKWGSHWFSKHVLKTLPTHLIENISRYIVVKPTFLARTKAWKNQGQGGEDAQLIDSAMCMVERIEDVHPLLFAPKENRENIFSGGPPSSPMFGAGGANILSPGGANASPSGSVNSTGYYPASPAASSTASGAGSGGGNNGQTGQTVWLTLPPSLMPEQERSNDPAAAVVRLYRGSLTILETLRSSPRETIASYLLDRSGISSSPVHGFGKDAIPASPGFEGGAAAAKTPKLAQLKTETGNPGAANSNINAQDFAAVDKSGLRKPSGSIIGNNLHPGNDLMLSPSSALLADPKATSEMAKKLKEQWVCTAARCSVHLEYFDQSPSVIQSLGSLLFDIVIDRFFTSAFGCFSKEALIQMAELFFCVDGSRLANNSPNRNRATSFMQTGEPHTENEDKNVSSSSVAPVPVILNPIDRIPAASNVFRGFPIGLLSGGENSNVSAENAYTSPMMSSPLHRPHYASSSGEGSTSEALYFWAAPGGVQRVMKFVREALLVYPYRGGYRHHQYNSAQHQHNNANHSDGGGADSAIPATPSTPSASSKNPAASGNANQSSAAAKEAQHNNTIPLNSMQSAIILAIAESIIPHNASNVLANSQLSSDVISLIHNVLFSPRDAMERVSRDIVFPLLASVLPATSDLRNPSSAKPEPHHESLRMAVESFTRCIASAVCRASLSVKNFGPASDWLELAVACALPRIAIDRRKTVPNYTSGQPILVQ